MTTYTIGVPGYITAEDYVLKTGMLKTTLSYRIRQKLPLDGIESVHRFGRLYLLKPVSVKQKKLKK